MSGLRRSIRRNSLRAAEGGAATIKLSGTRQVADDTAAGVTIGTFSVGLPGTWAFSLDAAHDADDRLTIAGADLRTTATPFDHSLAATYTIRVRAVRAAPYAEIGTTFAIGVVDVVDPIVLDDLPVEGATVQIDIPAGTELVDFGAGLAGETRTLSPNDGRAVFNDDQTKLLRGLSSWSAGEIEFTVNRVLDAATNSPHPTVFTITVEERIRIVPINTSAPTLAPDPLVVGLSEPDFEYGSWDHSPTIFETQWYLGPTAEGPWAEASYPFDDEADGQFTRIGVIAANADGPSEEAFSNVVSVDAVPVPVIQKWNNTVFRATINGHASWEGGAIVDLNDGENETVRIIAGLPNYPSLIPGSTYNHGRTGSVAAGSSADATPALAGSDPLLGGTAGWSTNTGLGYTRECAPGNYDFRIAVGQSAGTGRTEAIFVFDGLLDNLAPSMATTTLSNMGFWDPATAFVLQHKVVSQIDLGVWECTTAGTSGATQPSGAGPTFTDGAVVWTRRPRNALVAFRVNTLASSEVIDQNGVRVTASAWRAQSPKEIAISGTWGNGFCVLKAYNYTPYIRTIGIRSAGEPLTALTLSTDTGKGVAGSPQVFAKQPSDLRAFRINAASGEQAPSSFALSGQLASYFKLTTYGSRTYLTHNATPIPDSLAGHRSLIIEQSSGGETRQTAFDCIVVSSQGKADTGWLSKISTPNWLNRKLVKDTVAATLWPGYQGQSFATDVLATSGADFITKLQAVPEGNAWHRIRLSNALYSMYSSDVVANKAMGPNGGILVEPDAGVTTAQARFNVFFRCNISGLQIRNCHVVCDYVGGYQVRMHDPGPTGINGSGYFNKLKVDGNVIGHMHLPGYTTEVDWNRGGFPFSMLHGQSFESTDNDFYGTRSCFGMTGVRAQRYFANSYRATNGDIWTGSNAATYTSTQGVFADDHCYIDCVGDGSWDEIDFVGFTSGSHSDRWQLRAFNQNEENWWANGGKNGENTAIRPQDKWSVGNTMLSTDSVPPSQYRVTAVGSTGMTGSTPPMGTGTGIVDGDVTWEWVRLYTTASDLYMNIEDCVDHSSCPLADGPARQWVIDSNGGLGGVAPNFGSHNCAVYMSANNNIVASMSSYGISSRSPGVVHAEYNTYAAPAVIASSRTDLPAAYIRSERGEVRTRRNYVRQASQGVWAASQDDKIVNWKSTSVLPNRPSDLLSGPFAVNAAGTYTYSAFDESGYDDLESFAAAWRTFMDSIDPTRGYQSD